MAAWCRGAGDGVTYEFHQVRGASRLSPRCCVFSSPGLTRPLPPSEMHGPTHHLHRGVGPVVESLQWGLQGHVSSVPRKGKTLAGTSWGIPRGLWVRGRGWQEVLHARTSPHDSPKMDGIEYPAGLRDLPGVIFLPTGWQGDRRPSCPCAHADTESRLSGSCSSSLRSSQLPRTAATSER